MGFAFSVIVNTGQFRSSNKHAHAFGAAVGSVQCSQFEVCAQWDTQTMFRNLHCCCYVQCLVHTLTVPRDRHLCVQLCVIPRDRNVELVATHGCTFYAV